MFPNPEALLRLAGATLIGLHDECAAAGRPRCLDIPPRACVQGVDSESFQGVLERFRDVGRELLDVRVRRRCGAG